MPVEIRPRLPVASPTPSFSATSTAAAAIETSVVRLGVSDSFVSAPDAIVKRLFAALPAANPCKQARTAPPDRRPLAAVS